MILPSQPLLEQPPAQYDQQYMQRFVALLNRFLKAETLPDQSVFGTLTAGNVVSTGVTTTAGLSSTAPITGTTAVFGQNGQAYVDVFNQTTGGTPAGGAHWRWFADLVGGGGGNLTTGFYDATNFRIPFGIDNNGVVTFPVAANIAFGSNWQSWTPTVTASGSMTISGVSVSEALYLRIGPIVHYKAYISLTTGGTASNQITVSLPVAAVANAITSVANAVIGPSYVHAVSFVYPAGGVIQVFNSGLANYGLGSIVLQMSGFYRVS